MPSVDECSLSQCPIEFMLELLGSKWSIVILRELWVHQRRTHELLSALPGISTKTLTARLRHLEAHGIVSRQVFPEVPPHVEYQLTDKGKELQPVFTALYQVGARWLESDSCVCPIYEDHTPVLMNLQ